MITYLVGGVLLVLSIIILELILLVKKASNTAVPVPVELEIIEPIKLVVPEVKYPCDVCQLPMTLLHYSINAGLCGACIGKMWCKLPPFDTLQREAYRPLQVMGLLCRLCHNMLTYALYSEHEGICGVCEKNA